MGLFSFAFQAGGNVSLGRSPLPRCQSQPAGVAGVCALLLVLPERQSSRKFWLLQMRAPLTKGCPATGVSAGVTAFPHPPPEPGRVLVRLLLNSRTSTTAFQKGFLGLCASPQEIQNMLNPEGLQQEQCHWGSSLVCLDVLFGVVTRAPLARGRAHYVV